MNGPSISVIVPVYKVEAYLQECIDSILAQTFTDFELILVNDGSPDNCGAICDQNAARDSRIRVIHQENQGVTRARANGVAAAKGEFINFVDSDDTIPPHSLATLAAHADGATDIVLGKYQDARHPEEEIITHKDYCQYLACMNYPIGGPVAKLYRKTLFDKTVFDIPAEVRIGEDVIMNLRIAYKTQRRIYNTNEIVYFYRDNAASTMHTCRTPEVIAAYQTHRLAAIPAEDLERFLSLGLADHLTHYWISATANHIRLPRSIRPAHKQLISFQKYKSFRLRGSASLLFYCTNPVIRAATLGLRRIAQWLRKQKG